eukprot:5588090-Amphidinium_carterae.1
MPSTQKLQEIDAHDVVIRVNDVLTFNDDVGHKSDIYFATMCLACSRCYPLPPGEMSRQMGSSASHASV